jgi:hypothetical protein
VIQYAYLITNNGGILKRLDAATVEVSSSDHYIWDIKNKGPKGQYSSAISIITEGLK